MGLESDVTSGQFIVNGGKNIEQQQPPPPLQPTQQQNGGGGGTIMALHSTNVTRMFVLVMSVLHPNVGLSTILSFCTDAACLAVRAVSRDVKRLASLNFLWEPRLSLNGWGSCPESSEEGWAFDRFCRLQRQFKAMVSPYVPPPLVVCVLHALATLCAHTVCLVLSIPRPTMKYADLC